MINNQIGVESQTAVTMDGLLRMGYFVMDSLQKNGKPLGSSQLPACQWQLARLRHRGAAAPALMADDSCIDSPQPPIFKRSHCGFLRCRTNMLHFKMVGWFIADMHIHIKSYIYIYIHWTWTYTYSVSQSDVLRPGCGSQGVCFVGSPFCRFFLHKHPSLT